MKKYLIIIGCFIISFLLIFFFILKVDRKLTFVETIIKEPVLYVEKIIEIPIVNLKNKINVLKTKNKLVDELTNLEKIKIENEKLKIDLDDKNNRIEELSNLININNDSKYKLIHTNIIVRNAGLWYQTLTLDKGFDYNIKKHNVVINSDGLVGIIDKVSKHTSTVKLLTSVNENYKIGVLIENEGDIIYGILSDFKNGLFVIRGISYNKEIKKDSLVKSSGLDDKMISDINIGVVDSVSKDNLDLEQIVYVRPSVDFNKINYASVMVKKWF